MMITHFRKYGGAKMGRLNMTFGMQNRGNNGSNPPWMGFCYGSWLPVFSLRKNNLFRDLNWHWLCFHGTFTVWAKG